MVRFHLLPPAPSGVEQLKSGKVEKLEREPFNLSTFNLSTFSWGYNSVGRVSALQAECRRFESDYLHQFGSTQASVKGEGAFRKGRASCVLRIGAGA